MHKPSASFALLLAACATAAPPRAEPITSSGPSGTDARALTALHEQYRVAGLETRRFTHAQLWAAIGPLIDAAPVLEREEVGRSVEGRPLFVVRYGNGPTPVLLWSQMHGDESTATMSLADLLHFLANSDDEPRARRLGEQLTIWMVPMLNPDGAERFQRRNAQGIDINRDARQLATPEGWVLRELQRRLQPTFGFNLHDQNVRIPVEGTERITAIALLAPPFDATRAYNAVRLRAARVAALMREAAEPLVGGHIARYDDTYNPRAFGDGMQRWGTSTVLVEAGAWPDDPEKQYLRQVNFVLLLSALEGIATEAYARVEPSGYRDLPFNGRPVNDLVVRGATLVAPEMAPFRADLAIDFAEPLHRRGGRIVDVGDLAEASARDTLEASGLFVHLPTESLFRGADGRWAVGPGMPASFVIRRGEEAASPQVWRVEAGRISAPAN